MWSSVIMDIIKNKHPNFLKVLGSKVVLLWTLLETDRWDDEVVN